MFFFSRSEQRITLTICQKLRKLCSLEILLKKHRFKSKQEFLEAIVCNPSATRLMLAADN